MPDIKRRIIPLALMVCILLLGVWLAWRLLLPVNVTVESVVQDLPLRVEAVPAQVQARPGSMVRVYFHIQNVDPAGEPVRATGQVEILPAEATSQVEVFNSTCGGTHTYLPGPEQDYAVSFRVRPLGLLDSRELTLRHLFSQPN
jgi:cytochrome c oxidase assembly protein Cox11